MSASPLPVAMIVLAAGKGTRMHSSLAKVLHPLAGRALLTHVLDVATSLAPQHLIVVVGHQAQAEGGCSFCNGARDATEGDEA